MAMMILKCIVILLTVCIKHSCYCWRYKDSLQNFLQTSHFQIRPQHRQQINIQDKSPIFSSAQENPDSLSYHLNPDNSNTDQGELRNILNKIDNTEQYRAEKFVDSDGPDNSDGSRPEQNVLFAPTSFQKMDQHIYSNNDDLSDTSIEYINNNYDNKMNYFENEIADYDESVTDNDFKDDELNPNDLSDESKIMDIEETLPLSSVIGGDLLKYSNDFKPTYNIEKVDSEQQYNNDYIMDDTFDDYDYILSENNNAPRDLMLNKDIKINSNTDNKETETEIASNFLRALLATIQIVTNSLFASNNEEFSLSKPEMKSESSLNNPFYVRKRYGGFLYPSTSPSSFSKRRRKHRKHRKNRSKKLYLHGEDDRSLVFLPLMRKYPYSNVVRLSSGCTGTLLTPYHVLTAAHCVHNGEDFKTNLQMLKIEIPDTMGFRVYYIQKISIPKDWRRSGHLSEAARASYDYAIVRLSIGVPGKTTFLPLSVPKSNILNQDMIFLGFPTDDDAGLYKSKCHSYYSMAYMDGNLILTRCDSAVGNSGAAVFIDDPRDGKRIVGILSNTMSVMSMSYISRRYSIITALTWNKLYEICSMMSPLGQDYGVCPSFETISRSSKVPLKNRVIPFFGR